MADDITKVKKNEDTISVPASLLKEIQDKMAAQDVAIENLKNKNESLEDLFSKNDVVEGKPKIRESRKFEPTFRTVRIRRYPVGTTDKEGYVIGWSKKGAYQMVDRSGVTPQTVDYLDIIFLGLENEKPQPVKLLDLFNRGVQVYCKILETKKYADNIGTGEEIHITSFDPKHGTVDTGEVIDGFYTDMKIEYLIQIPGIDKPLLIDAKYCN